MKKSFSTTGILVAVLAILSGWYLIYEKKFRPEQKEAEEKGKQIVSVDREKVQAVDIFRLGADGKTEKVGLKKSGKDWLVVAPVEDKADSATISSMLVALVSTKQDRVVEEDAKSLEPFGLDKPALRIVMQPEAPGSPTEVFIGADTPTGNANFVRIGTSNKIFKIDRSLKTSLDHDASFFRKKEIFTFGRAEIAEVELAHKQSVVARRKPNNGTPGLSEKWMLLRENVPADTTKWTTAFHAITDLKAKGFAAEKTDRPSEFGLSAPVVKVILKSVDDKRETVTVGKVKDKYYARRDGSPVVFEVEKDFADKMTKPASDFFDLSLADFNRFDTNHVVLDREGSKLDLVKKDGSWKLSNDPAAAIDSAKIDSLLAALQDAKGLRFTRNNPNPKTVLEIQVFEQPKGKPETEVLNLKFGPPKGREYSAKKTGLPGELWIDEATWKKFNLSKADLLMPAPKPSAPKQEAKQATPGAG